MFPSGLASQEGTIQKGYEVLSINGKSLKGATHNDALALLRQARDPRQAVIVTRKLPPEATPDLNSSADSTASASGAGDISVESSKFPQLSGSPVGPVTSGYVGPVLAGLCSDPWSQGCGLPRMLPETPLSSLVHLQDSAGGSRARGLPGHPRPRQQGAPNELLSPSQRRMRRAR